MLMKNLVFSVLFFLSTNFSFAQEVVIKVANSKDRAALYSLSGEKSSFIDSISFNNNTYNFNLSSHHSGFYRLIFYNKKWLDFIYDSNDIKIETDADNTLANTKIIQSEENRIYYDFINLNKNYNTKTEILYLVLARYPVSDNYHKITIETLQRLQEEYLYFINVTAQSKPESFIARYVRSAQLPVIGNEISSVQHLTFLKSYSLDKVNFNDDALIYSDVFANKAIEYLSYYRNPQLPMALLEKEFETAIDSILNKAKVNDIVYKHIVEYLLDGFKKFGFDNVINYIVENYVIKDNICLDEKLETALERRINQSRLFNPGYVVPEISLLDQNNEAVQLSKIQSEKTLIIFYASWCPHCKTLLPQISELYKNQKEKTIEVLAISIDTSKTDWVNFIRTNKLEWLNASDLKGWEGKAVLDYNIYATPTMFLVGKSKNFIKILNDLEELKKYFN